MLLDAGADISATSYLNEDVNRNGLLQATTKGHAAVVKVLLKRVIDVNIKGEREETALNRAALNGDSEIVRILLKAKAKVDNADAFWNTPFLCALREGHLKVAELLLTKCASYKSKNRDSKTPLHYAVRWGFFKVARSLIRNGADVNEGYNKFLPHYGTLETRTKNIDVLTLLLRAGAEFPSTTSDYYDGRIYSLISSCGHEKFRLLFDYGAVPRGWKSSSALLYSAAVHGNLNVHVYT
ncbi:Ankyrin repeat protein [Aspergillus sclerotialis]|uniref:Ankyrin repeat protein n=1 Tax=Aspergillus sclerotialis TaxID=2070753 RepID=A0A3A2ZLA8_9EURO|nr:Ankyrin repeat protein [Aspergillus sclerotialis]